MPYITDLDATDNHEVPAIVTKVYGTRSLSVQVVPKGPTLRRRVKQL